LTALNVAIVGLGKMGLLHSCIFNGLNESEIVAICETDKIMYNIIGKYLKNIKMYQNYEKMIEKEELDAIAITTPVFLHKSMIEKALLYNINVFSEKPLAINGEECRSIIKRKRKIVSMVGYCRRFMHTYQFAKDIITSCILGKPIYFNSQLYVSQVFKAGKGWLYNPIKSGGGVLIDLGSHAFDLFNYLFNDIQSVNGFSKCNYNNSVEDYAIVNMRFEDGLIGSLQLSWSIPNYRLPELKINIILDRGTISVTEKYVEIWSKSDSDNLKKGLNVFYKQDLAKNVQLNIAGPEYTLEDQHFLHSINNGNDTKCSFEEAAKANFVIDAIYSSINSNRVEDVRYGV